MNEYPPTKSFDLLYRTSKALRVESLCSSVFENPKFIFWSGSSKPNQHHYGRGGLVIHTAEVYQIAATVNTTLTQDKQVDSVQLFLACLFHDVGKMWDYENHPYEGWRGTLHKRQIHHISRSGIEWARACTLWGKTVEATELKVNIDELEHNVLHAILSHHGQREWGSPVAPNTRLAWLLHLCDGISARMDDCVKFDRV